METRERPILFKTPLVEQILAGAKTQTRRPVKNADNFWPHSVEQMLAPKEALDAFIRHHCPLGQPGDRLWVRETWQALVLNSNYRDWVNRDASGCPDYDEWWEAVETADLEAERKNNSSFSLVYRAGASEAVLMDIELWGWRPSIHMYRWACRLVLEVTRIRVERLQEISGEDLRAEGYDFGLPRFEKDARRQFVASWDATYAKKGAGWVANPWVWVADFKVVEKPAPPEDLAMTEEEKEQFDRDFREKVRQMKERGDDF